MQGGQVYKLDKSWAFRYRAPDGSRPQRGGFRTKGEARAALTEALRRASVGEGRHKEPPTFAALVNEYLEQHVAAEITIETLRYRLQHAVAAFGALRVDRLSASAIGAWRKLDENPAALIPNPAPR